MSIPVAFDVGPLQGQRTGIGRAVAALADALAERDDVVLHPYLTSWRARPAPGTTRLPFPAAVAHRCWRWTDHPRADRWLGDAAVVHGTNYVVPPTRRVRLVSVYDCWFLTHSELAHPSVVRAGAVLRRSLDRGAIAVCSSDATARVLRALAPAADVHTVHLGALPLATPTASCPIAELDGAEFIVSVATLERRKNLPRLVDAFGLLAIDRPGLRLVLAGGDGDDRLAVDRAIDRLRPDVGRRVLLTGYVDDAVQSWLLRTARVVAYPSLDEGFGFPLLDAMQAGTPIVASTAGSIPEVAGDAALTVRPDDTPALAAALERALDDEVERTRLITAGHRRAATFTWSATAAALAELYRQLAQRVDHREGP